jgi:hypothetical protein
VPNFGAMLPNAVAPPKASKLSLQKLLCFRAQNVGEMDPRFPKFLMGLEILFFYDVNAGKYSYLAFYPQIQVSVATTVVRL